MILKIKYPSEDGFYDERYLSVLHGCKDDDDIEEEIEAMNPETVEDLVNRLRESGYSVVELSVLEVLL